MKIHDDPERSDPLAKPDADELRTQFDAADFIENAAVPLHAADQHGIILWANQAELDYLGYTKEEYTGKSITLFHADKVAITDILNRLRHGETVHNYRAELLCRDGTVKHVLISANVLSRNGKFIHTRCFTRDYNEIVKEEERKTKLLADLEESEARLRMAIASTRLGTWDYEPASNKLIWSDQCRNIYGALPDTPVSFEIFVQHIYPEDSAYALSAIAKAMDPAGDRRYDVTYRILRFDNNAVRWIRAQGRVTFNAAHTPIRFIGTVIDITDLKLAELKSARLVAIVESSDDAIISKTLDGIITSWNPSAERTFGYTAEEITGQSILKLIPPDRHDEETFILSRLRRGERVEHFETKRLTKAGKLLDISLTISPIKDPEGRIVGLSKIARDITDKKMEEQRKNGFLSMVSHELNTPLTTLHSYAQILLEKAKKEQDNFSVMALTKMEMQTKRMNTMIVDFLNLARLEEGKLPMKKEVFDLQILLEEVVADGKFLTVSHQLVLNSDAEVPVLADRIKIGQVLTNLLSNAIKYSGAGSVITINCVKENEKVKIAISDQGVGISAKDQQRLFERFYRVENEQVKNVSGFGIGLYLVSEILLYHNSRIEVESEEGRGAVFNFSLDIHRYL